MSKFAQISSWFSRLGSWEQIIRFFWIGLANSALTYLIYLALILFIDYRLSYALSYISGIMFSVYFNGRFVFRADISIKTVMIYSLFYSTSFGIGLFLLTLFVNITHISEAIAPLFVLVITVPINFFGARLVLTGNILNKPLAPNSEKNDHKKTLPH